MKYLSSISFFVIFLSLSIAAFAQNPSATPTTDDDILKISTNLIQVDVTVTDKKGNIVTNLKPEDFEVYENGKKQDITNFSFVSNESATTPKITDSVSNKKNSANQIPVAPVELKPNQVKRTYALVVDDLGLSFENVPAVTQSLNKFIREQIQPGDLVAIIRTGSGVGALQSFTSDKRQLFAAVEKIRWNPQGRGGISSFAAISPNFKEQIGGAAGDKEDKEFQSQLDEFRSENFSAGTLGALNYVIRGMRELPGRKSVVLFSEGFQLIISDSSGTRVTRTMQNLRVLADLANRASVVFYTIDPRGLQMPGMATAEDNNWGTSSESFDQSRENRNSNFLDSQQSLRYLAYETGGLPFVNQNNLNLGLERAVNDQKGYYLLGYQPDEDTFDPKKNKFNKLVIKLKREDLRVRYRSGFFGVSDQRLAQVKQTPQQQINDALTSPFSTSGISLTLSTLFADDEKVGTFIRSLVNIDAKNLKFTEEPDGTRKANFDIVARTYGDNGAPIDEFAKNYTIRVGEKAYQKILDKSFIYNLSVPVKKPGGYQFRVALRDSASEKIGSASQYVEIPNLKKGHLTLSGIVLENYTADEWQKMSLAQDQNSVAETDVNADTSYQRRYKRGTILRYDYLIYNAKINPLKVQVQAKLFRDGQLVVSGDPSPIDVTGQTDLKRIQGIGAVTLGKNLKSGSYVLQVIATDSTAPQKRRLAARWVDFEVVE